MKDVSKKSVSKSKHWEGLPDSYQVRPATMEDIQQAVDLFNACSIAMIGVEDFSVPEIRNDWATPNFQLEKCTRVILNRENHIIAYTEVWDVSNPPVHPFVWGRVHPHYEGKGIGTAILKWSLDRAKQVMDRVPEEARVSARAYAISTYEPSKQLLEDHGMQMIRSSWQMEIDLDQSLPKPQWPDGISLVPYEHARDGEEVYRANEDAFRDHWGFVETPYEEGYERWLHFMIQDEEYDPDLWFITKNGKEIAGAALCRRRSWESEDTGWVRSLFVRKPFRRQGLALALLQHTFHEYKKRGKKHVGLGVDSQNLTGATRLYENARMHVKRQYNHYELELRPGLELAKT
jgi:mycothiol synthase